MYLYSFRVGYQLLDDEGLVCGSCSATCDVAIQINSRVDSSLTLRSPEMPFKKLKQRCRSWRRRMKP